LVRWCVAALLVLVTACGGGSTTTSSSPSASAAPRWQMVWFSDSGAWGIAADWAKAIEQAHGVKVEVFDYIGYGGLGSVSKVLARVRDDDRLRKQLAGAEVVMLYASADDLPLDFQKACLSMTSTRRPRPFTDQTVAPFRERLTQLFDEVVRLRSGRPTLMRSLDLYVPVVADWHKAGVYRPCSRALQGVAAVQREVAAAHDVPLVSMYAAFNGPRGDQDPVQKGYVAPDGIHTTAAGKAVILAAIEATGYQLVAR
jgi:lysophospholipase L1-like esterase